MASSGELDLSSEPGRSILLVVALAILVPCVITIVREHRQAAAIDPTRFHRVHGVVTQSDDYYVRVSYDDGRKTATLGAVGATRPEMGTRVLLESWHGSWVSALDPVNEHRYRGDGYPKSANGGAIVGVVIGGLLFSLWAWLATQRLRQTT
jgi:hypothetical protein